MDTWTLDTMDTGLWIKLYWIGSYWTLAWTYTGLDYLDLGQEYSGLPWITFFLSSLFLWLHCLGSDNKLREDVVIHSTSLPYFNNYYLLIKLKYLHIYTYKSQTLYIFIIIITLSDSTPHFNPSHSLQLPSISSWFKSYRQTQNHTASYSMKQGIEYSTYYN
jgi:hypothetical protein